MAKERKPEWNKETRKKRNTKLRLKEIKSGKKKQTEKLGISKRKKRLTEIVRKIEREGKAGLRGEGWCEGCWIKHVEIRSVQQALKNLAGPRLNSKAQRIRGRNLLELND